MYKDTIILFKKFSIIMSALMLCSKYKTEQNLFNRTQLGSSSRLT
jgi:hypothetical protein